MGRVRLEAPRARPPLSDRWICHVCGMLRPDELIGTAQGWRRNWLGLDGAAFGVSARYCLDKDECGVGAVKLVVDWLPEWRDPGRLAQTPGAAHDERNP